MKIKYSILISLFITISSCCGKTNDNNLGKQSKQSFIQRNEAETTEQFAERLKPENSKISHKVISAQWNSLPVIIAFYDQTYKLSKNQDPDQTNYHRIIATLFVENQKNNYNKVIINTFDTDGGSPKIETILFANADKDVSKELITIVSWELSSQEVSGTIYKTFIYDDLLKNKSDKPVFLKEISTKLDGGCECSFSDGRNKKAKLKTAKDIKVELLKLGYK